MSELNREFLLDQIERMSRILEYHHAEYTPVELKRHQDQITVFQMALAHLASGEAAEGLAEAAEGIVHPSMSGSKGNGETWIGWQQSEGQAGAKLQKLREALSAYAKAKEGKR